MKLILFVSLLATNVFASSRFQQAYLNAGDSGIYYDYSSRQPVEVNCNGGAASSSHYCYCKLSHPGMNTYLYELRRVDANGSEKVLDIFDDAHKAACEARGVTHPACL